MLKLLLMTGVLGALWAVPALVLHEFGHVLAAAYTGTAVHGIVLRARPLRFGVRMAPPSSRAKLALITAAGPLANVLIAVWWYKLFGQYDVLPALANLTVGIGALLPVAPMTDGAKLLRLLKGEEPNENARQRVVQVDA